MPLNILFIIADDLNAWIGALGRNPDVKTPNIDALASRGVLFTHAYCSAPYCNASRMGIFTGCLPTTTGIYHNEPLWDRPGRPVTFIEYLREAGYHTVGAGKVFHGVFDYSTAGSSGVNQAEWREIENRSELWDRFFANSTEPLPEARPLNKLFDFKNFASVPSMYHHFDWGPIPENRIDSLPDAKVTRSVVDFLLSAPPEPFFCAAGLYKPHLPWHAPERFFDIYNIETITLPLVRWDDLDDVPPIGREWASSPRDHDLVVSRGQWRAAVQGYLAAISYCDHLVGEIIAALDQSGLTDRTAIVFCGDNGFHLGEKLHWRKFALWEEATRVPLILSTPKNRPNRRIYQPVSLIDIYPTVMSLCGLDCAPVDGFDLSPLLTDVSESKERPPVIMTWGPGNHSVRTTEWRLIQYRDGTEELYDHRVDRHEWQNLATIGDFEDVLTELRRRLPTEGNSTHDDDHCITPRRQLTGPDFLGIGVQKAGTTWLYEILKRHPDVEFPAGKEIHFWDKQAERPATQWLDFFKPRKPGKKQGEITPAYSFLESEAIRKIAELVPQVRLFISIRNPIERAWSSALMALERAEMTIDEASDIWFIEHFKSLGSRQRSDYVSCLDRWKAEFSCDHLHVILFDDLVRDPRSVITTVSNHIGVDPGFFNSIPDSELTEPIFQGTGDLLRPRLREYLHIVYGRQISTLEKKLQRNLSHWLH
jgi:arylsulfatase A-like enzyme